MQTLRIRKSRSQKRTWVVEDEGGLVVAKVYHHPDLARLMVRGPEVIDYLLRTSNMLLVMEELLHKLSDFEGRYIPLAEKIQGLLRDIQRLPRKEE